MPLEQIQQLQQLDPIRIFLDFYANYEVVIKFISVLLTVFFLSGALYSMIITGWLSLRVSRVNDVFLKKNVAKKGSIKAWKNVKKHFFAGDISNLKLAVLEGDKLLDDTLRIAGFFGETMGDKLKRLTDAELPNIEDVWEAHKLRNRIVHEMGFDLKRDTAERALEIYEKAFKDLGIID